jgi:hypothetical protein
MNARLSPQRFAQRALLPAFMLFACSYGSVRTAGDVALTLPEHVPVLQDGGDLCRLGAATSGDTERARCDAFDANQPIYARAARELASYGLALKELSGAGQIPAADLVSGLVSVGDVADISTLGDEQRTALGHAVRIVVDVFAEGYKKRHLRSAVVESDRAVQCIVHRQLINAAAVKLQISGLEQDLAAELEDVEFLSEKFDRPVSSRSAPVEEPALSLGDEPALGDEFEVVDAVARGASARAIKAVGKARKEGFRARRDVVRARRVLARSGMLLVSQARRRIDALERGLTGFAAAHNTLACASEKIGSLRDKQLTGAVGRAIRCATTSRSEGKRAECGQVWRSLERTLSCEDVEALVPRCSST